MTETPQCPICTTPEPLIAEDGFECAVCGHAWLVEVSDEVPEVRDVNGIGAVPRDEAFTLKHNDLLEIQIAAMRKIVQELKAFDNLYSYCTSFSEVRSAPNRS